MLKKNNRLCLQSEFREIKNKGRQIHGPLFSYVYLFLENKERKFAFVISKRISNKAVVRNRIRRLLSESVRRNIEMFPEGMQILFLVKTRIVGEGVTVIEEAIKKIPNQL